MIKGKKQILLLSILGVTTLLVAIIGATYAYFTTSMTGRNGTINTTTAKIGTASFTAESVSVDKVLPGWTSGEKNVSVTLEPSDYDVKYTCTLKMTANPLTDLTLKVTGTNALTSVNGKLKSGVSDTIIASGTLKASQTKQSVSMTYTLSFQETGVDQNTQQGKTITGLVTCSTEGQTVYYNSDNPNGTTTKPTGTNGISLQEAILEDNPTIEERTDFNVANTATTTGTIYQTNKTEDGSTVYYYSGNTTNNWVKFGKETIQECTYNGDQVHYGIYDEETGNSYKNIREVTSSDECVSTNVCLDDYYGPIIGLADEEECDKASFGGTWTGDIAIAGNKVEKEIYWRIIRTNEDGSVRILYLGISPDTTYSYIRVSPFNENENDPMYVGYMYGTSGSLENNRTNTNDSIIKTHIDTWYQNNLLINYNKYISKTAIYCNDRSVGSGSFNTGSSTFYYGARTRLNTNKSPSYKCGANASNGLFESTQAVEDKFSASTEGGGNGQLTYPVALMTADELSFAGGKYSTPLSGSYPWYSTNSRGESVLSDNLSWWTLSPSAWYSSDSNVFDVFNKNGSFIDSSVYYSLDVIRPVISLKSCVEYLSGNGTPESPYEVTIDDTCASAEN